MDWEEGEEFKVLENKIVFKEHGYNPSRNKKVLYGNMLEENGFNISIFSRKYDHFIVRLK